MWCAVITLWLDLVTGTGVVPYFFCGLINKILIPKLRSGLASPLRRSSRFLEEGGGRLRRVLCSQAPVELAASRRAVDRHLRPLAPWGSLVLDSLSQRHPINLILGLSLEVCLDIDFSLSIISLPIWKVMLCWLLVLTVVEKLNASWLPFHLSEHF